MIGGKRAVPGVLRDSVYTWEELTSLWKRSLGGTASTLEQLHTTCALAMAFPSLQKRQGSLQGTARPGEEPIIKVCGLNGMDPAKAVNINNDRGSRAA